MALLSDQPQVFPDLVCRARAAAEVNLAWGVARSMPRGARGA